MDTDVKMSISKQGFEVQGTKKKILGKRYEPEVTLEDKVYPEMYNKHQPGTIVVDETLTNIKAQGLQITRWTLTKDQQQMKPNLRTNAEPQMVKIKAQLETCKVLEMEQLLKEFKDVFAWTYKDLKGIPLELAQHKIELDTTIPLAHQAKYRLNPNYVTVVKQDIYKLLVTRFIESVEKAAWLSPQQQYPKKMAS